MKLILIIGKIESHEPLALEHVDNSFECYKNCNKTVIDWLDSCSATKASPLCFTLINNAFTFNKFTHNTCFLCSLHTLSPTTIPSTFKK